MMRTSDIFDKNHIIMAHKHEHSVREALVLLSATTKGIEAILNHPELATVKRSVIAQISKSGQALQKLTGVILISNPNADNIQAIMASLQPLNSIGGEPIDRVNPVSPEDLDLNNADKEQFVTNRDALLSRFIETAIEDLFKFSNQPQGEAMIRSIARLSGHPAFRIAEISVNFFEEIKERLRFSAALEMTVGRADLVGEEGIDQNLDDDLGLDDGDPGAAGGPNYATMFPTDHQSEALTINETLAREPIPGTVAVPIKAKKTTGNGGTD